MLPEYALKLKALHDELGDTLYIVMRICFEKPRTTVGWKGLINDPRMDDSFHIEEGLHKARELLLWLANLGLPVATDNAGSDQSPVPRRPVLLGGHRCAHC